MTTRWPCSWIDIVESGAKCESLASAVRLGSAVTVASAGAPDSAVVVVSAAAPGPGDRAQPTVPSDFRASMARGGVVAQLVAHFAKLCALGSQGKRFGQPIVLRFKGTRTVKGVGVQPIADSIWQATSMFGAGELADIAPPKEVVDLVAGAAAKARKGDVAVVALDVVKHPHCQYRRGTDIFVKIFDHAESACETFSKRDGKPHPALFLDSTSWGGDSICAAAERVRKVCTKKNLDPPNACGQQRCSLAGHEGAAR